MAGLVALAWALSENRRAVPWRAVASGLVLLMALAVLFLKVPLVKEAFMKANDALLVLERATQAGTSLVFGYLGGGPTPYAVSDVGSNFVLAFRALPIVARTGTHLFPLAAYAGWMRGWGRGLRNATPHRMRSTYPKARSR